MKALCWMGTGKVEVHNVSEPRILNPHDAIIKVTRTAICGSDLHLFDGFIPTMEEGGHSWSRIHGHRGKKWARRWTIFSAVDRVGGAVHNRMPAKMRVLQKEDSGSACDNHQPERPPYGSRLRLLRLWPVRIFPHDGEGMPGGQAQYVSRALRGNVGSR